MVNCVDNAIKKQPNVDEISIRDVVTACLKMITAEDKKLPSVQPIRVTMPENYPENSPTCRTVSDQSGKYSVCDVIVMEFLLLARLHIV